MRLAKRLKLSLSVYSMIYIVCVLMLIKYEFGVQQDNSVQSFGSEYRARRKRFKSTWETHEGYDWMTREQERRKQRVQRVCDGDMTGFDTEIIPNQFENILVDDTYQLLYCETPKVSCTNWKRILLILSGKMNTTDPAELPASKVHGEYSSYLRKLSSYTPEEIEHRLKQYFKYMFVRNPLERILSAYYNKFTMDYNKFFPQTIGRKIIWKYRKRPTAKAVRRGTDVQFTEFVKYLLDPATTAHEPFNVHWRQFHQLCHPCVVNYDFIGKFEWIKEDSEHVLQQLGLANLVQFPTSPPKNYTIENIMSDDYEKISPEYIHRLWELYKVNYAMFGYDYPDTAANKNTWN